MNKYIVKLYARAYRDLDGIYTYIAENLLEPGAALNMVDELEAAILSLEQLPERGAIRRVGAYANGDYRQLFVKNYVIIYRVLKQKKRCISLQYAIHRAISKLSQIVANCGNSSWRPLDKSFRTG